MDESVETGFVAKTLTLNGTDYHYAVYVPEGYTRTQTWPGILFLHGWGERGDDGLSHTQVGLGKAIREHPERFPCIVVMPQCRLGENWQGEMEDLALRALDLAIAEYGIDPNRIVLTGLSMGGFGTWRIGSTYVERFAGLVPICGGGDPTAREKLARVPIWCFHGDADQAVPVDRSREMVAAVRKGSNDVQYTELLGVGHNSWDTAYGDPKLITWMLQRKRAGGP